MSVERVSSGSSLIDVLDRALDGGIVIDTGDGASSGIDLLSGEVRVVVVSAEALLEHDDALEPPGARGVAGIGRSGLARVAAELASVQSDTAELKGWLTRLAR